MGFMKRVKLMDAHPQASNFLSSPIAFIFLKNGDTCHQEPIEYCHNYYYF